MPVKEIADDADFKRQMAGQRMVFYAFFFKKECEKCYQVMWPFQRASDIVDSSAKVFLKVDIDKCPNSAFIYSVTAHPTILVLKKNAVIDRVESGDINKLLHELEIALGQDSSSLLKQQIYDEHFTRFWTLLLRKSTVIDCTDDLEFEKHLAVGENSKLITFAFFYSNEDNTKLPEYYGTLADSWRHIFLSVNVDRCRKTAAASNVSKVPIVLAFSNGEVHVVDEFISKKVKSAAGTATTVSPCTIDVNMPKLMFAEGASLLEEATVIDCVDDEDFREKLSIIGHDKIALVLFVPETQANVHNTIYTVLNNQFEHAAKRYTNWGMVFLRVTMENCRKTAEEFNISRLYTILVLKNGNKEDETHPAIIDDFLSNKLVEIQTAAAQYGLFDITGLINVGKVKINGREDMNLKKLLVNESSFKMMRNMKMYVPFTKPVVLHYLLYKGVDGHPLQIGVSPRIHVGTGAFISENGFERSNEVTSSTEAFVSNGKEFHLTRLLKPMSMWGSWLSTTHFNLFEESTEESLEISELIFIGTPLGLNWKHNYVTEKKSDQMDDTPLKYLSTEKEQQPTPHHFDSQRGLEMENGPSSNDKA